MLANLIIPAIPTGTELTALLVVICFSAGLNIYATVAMLGLLARAHFLTLPDSLHVLVSWYVIGICGALFAIEFIGDKIPVFDLFWNAMHTFVRVPAAALLTYAATAQLPEWERLAATFVGASIALAAHAGKGGGANGSHRIARTFLQHGAQHERGSVGCVSHLVCHASRVCGRGNCSGGISDHRDNYSSGYPSHDVPVSRHRTHAWSLTKVCCGGLTKPWPRNSPTTRRKPAFRRPTEKDSLLFLFPEKAAKGSRGSAGSASRATSRSCASLAQAFRHAAKIRKENGIRRGAGKSKGDAATSL